LYYGSLPQVSSIISIFLSGIDRGVKLVFIVVDEGVLCRCFKKALKDLHKIPNSFEMPDGIKLRNWGEPQF